MRRKLAAWYERNRRPLPWRETRDPYRIWISEVMLQQTRAQAVIPYYGRFLERFPTVEALAAAPLDEVLARWAGLGYYHRARNLHRAARQIAAGGAFPAEYTAIRALPGVGEYTAAAVASIAFDLPHAVLDGNVLRVLARLHNEPGEITAAATQARLRAAAGEMLDRRHPGRFNQAMMELGATLCTPRSPECPRCPIAFCCAARQAGTAAQLPVKRKKQEPVRIAATLVVIVRRGHVLLGQRTGPGRMQGFWELPEPRHLAEWQRGCRLGEFGHTIMHYRFRIDVIEGAAAARPEGFRWIPAARLKDLPLSTTARKALRLCARFAKVL